MKNLFTTIRNTIIKFFYKNFLKRLLFLVDPEKVHHRFTQMGKLLGANPFTRFLTKLTFNYQNKILEQNLFGHKFKNPVGLSAGFDKNAELTQILPAVGFGLMEVGTITGEPCKGNEKPRLWRLPKSQALVVNWGLMNDGCEKAAEHLQNKKFQIPLIISVGKTNCAETVDEEAGIKDYFKSYEKLLPLADIIDINISCPNAFGGEPFTDPLKLEKLLNKIREIKTAKPVFLKMPCDLPFEKVDHLLEIAQKHQITGVICTNLTKERNNPKIIDENIPETGAISGKVVEEKADRMIAYIYKKTQGKLPIIGVGGIFSAEDAYKKIKLGASLVQLITGMIFEGPQLISEINLGLAKLLKKDGFKSLSEAIGIENKY